MCGITGAACKEPQVNRTWLTISRDTLNHRGPDDAGDWWSKCGRVGFAHRRLSIFDLSPLGHQPMHLQEAGLSLVFNGEIYNFVELRRELELLGHRFKSVSDTEVLLVSYAQWGTDCLLRLNGMFAFAIFDAFKQKLFLARDRAGEKPLFYYKAGDCLYFGSELKALLQHPFLPRQIDAESLDCYLAMGFVPGDRCILKGYSKLAPANAMTFELSNGSIRVWRYWEPPNFQDCSAQVDENALLNELDLLIENSVGRQLLADVPVGILLSGGVDSSIITAMAARHSQKVRTFSISFPGHGNFDEASHARLIAKYFDTDHTELHAEPTSADLMDLLARQFDEPIVDSSIFPTFLVSRLVSKNCTVALGGDGGDELFAGYSHYSQLLNMQRWLGSLPLSLRQMVARSAERLLPIGLKGRNFLQGLEMDLAHSLPLVASHFDITTRRRLLRGYSNHSFVAEQIIKSRIPTDRDLLKRVTRFDFENGLPEAILVKVDRASMLNSLEVRSPLLDYRVIEFAFGKVPPYLKATRDNKKILLKRLAARILPPQFDRNRKQGFSIPLTDWLKSGPFRDLFWDTLNSSDVLFDSSTLSSLLKGQDRGFSNSERLFALVQFELWRKCYGVCM